MTEPALFSKRLDLLVWSVIAAVLSAVALDTFLTSRTSFAAVMVLTVVALVVVLLLVGLVWARGDDPSIRLIALGFLPVLVMAVFPLARGLNLIAGGPLTRYGVAIGAAIEMPILFYALSLRSSHRREAQVRAGALSRTDPLTGLAHSRALLQRLEGTLVRSHSQKHACALLAIKLGNHETIAAQHGRETGERALVLAASLLRHVTRDVDLAARIGDHHFALLLEGPVSGADAVACATKVVAGGLRESEMLPVGVTLKFQVAAALLPEYQYDAASSLQWLLGAVSEITPDARKSIRAVNF